MNHVEKNRIALSLARLISPVIAFNGVNLLVYQSFSTVDAISIVWYVRMECVGRKDDGISLFHGLLL